MFSVFQSALSEEEVVSKILRSHGMSVHPRQISNAVSAKHRVGGLMQRIRDIMTKMALNGYGHFNGHFYKDPNIKDNKLLQYGLTLSEYHQYITSPSPVKNLKPASNFSPQADEDEVKILFPVFQISRKS